MLLLPLRGLFLDSSHLERPMRVCRVGVEPDELSGCDAREKTASSELYVSANATPGSSGRDRRRPSWKCAL